jgi:hypothetical protein
MAMILDENDPAELAALGWYVSESAHAHFGRRLTNAEVGQANLGTRLGFVELDGDEVYVERLETTKRGAWMRTKDGDLGDLRLLGNHKDAASARHLPLATALGLMRETKFDHRILTEAFRLAITGDQLDVSKLLSFEHLARRLVRHETAVSRCPSHPDYSGLVVVMLAPTSATGQAMTTAFNEYITTKKSVQAKGGPKGGAPGGGGGAGAVEP